MRARIAAMPTYERSLGWAWPVPVTVSSWEWAAAPAAAASCKLIGPPPLADQVDDGEDDDPHHVDEVPVQAGDLDHLGPGRRQGPPQRHDHEAQQDEDPDGHVDAVEPGQDVEGRALEVDR